MGLSLDKFKKMKEAQKDDQFEPLELTENAVNVIYRRCLLSEETDPNDIVGFTLFSKKCGYDEDECVQYFSKSALQKNRSYIYYLLGQLYDVNHPDADGFNGFVYVKNISLNYKGEPWIEASDVKKASEIVIRLMLLSLVWSGSEEDWPLLFPPKRRVADDGEHNDFCENYFIRPTLSPNDPDFEKWSQSEDGAPLLSLLKSGEEIPPKSIPPRFWNGAHSSDTASDR